MKRFRRPLIAAGALVAVLIVVVAVVFSSTFQTWAARKALASQTGMRATVGSVSAGTKRVEVRELRIEQDGAILTVPRLEAGLPVFSAALREKVLVARLVAKGWTLDLSNTGGAAPTASSGAGSPGFSRNPTDAPAKAGTANASATSTPAAIAAQAFAGIFAQLELPVDLSVDGLDLEGEVVLPDSRGRMKLALNGGGLGHGREGRFDLSVDAILADPNVNAAEVRGELVTTMDTPRTFTRLTASLGASVSGAQFPNGLMLTADLAAARSDRGETYSVAVANQAGEILAVKGDFPRGAQRLDGTWKIDVRDADLAPFALGRPLPGFVAVGAGTFDTDPAFTAIRASGQLNATTDRLQAIRPELSALGELRIVADFDLAERGGAFSVQKFEAAISAAEPVRQAQGLGPVEKPVATMRALQAFEFNPRTGELRATEAARELLGIVLEGVPLAWAKPFLTDFEIEGGQLRGEFVATAQGGGGTLRSIAPLALDGIHVTHGGKALAERVHLELDLATDYTPQGWQAEITGFTATSGDDTLLTLDAKVGQLAGTRQPLKATGKLSAVLPALLAQPAFEGMIALTSGDVAIDFVASFDEKKEIQANLSLKSLMTVVDTNAVKLPSLSADVRVDFAAGGEIAFNVPLLIERDDRKSDLRLFGTLAPEKDNVRTIDAQATSTQLVIDDAKVFAVIVPLEAGEAPKPERDNAPPWAGVHGSIGMQLKRVVYSELFEVTDVAGRLRIDAGMVKLEGLEAGLGGNGRANLDGMVTFTAGAEQPYALAADIVVKEFDPGPLFHAMSADQPATVEGKFDLSSKLLARASTLGDLAPGAGGEFHLTSRGGVFRGLPINVSNLVEHSSRIAAWLATAGTALSAMTGRKEYIDVANKAQAVAELAKGLNPILYDQLSVVLLRDASLNTTLERFTLIAPEVRLTGSGATEHQPGSSLLDDSLAMEFTLRARGRQGDLLKYLGALETQTDDLGYAACTLPLKVGGTLGNPDASELNGTLTALALEKSGVTEKASELFNKVFGSGGK